MRGITAQPLNSGGLAWQLLGRYLQRNVYHLLQTSIEGGVSCRPTRVRGEIATESRRLAMWLEFGAK